MCTNQSVMKFWLAKNITPSILVTARRDQQQKKSKEGYKNFSFNLKKNYFNLKKKLYHSLWLLTVQNFYRNLFSFLSRF